MKAKINNYLSTKNAKRRRRTDGLMIMVAIIGIAGSVLVFNSYASRKIETQTPGSYSFVKLLSQSGSELSNVAKVKSQIGRDIYYLNKSASISTPFTLPNSKFCIYGWNRTGARLGVGFSNIPNQLSMIDDNLGSDYPLTNGESRPLKCFDTSKNQNSKGELIINADGNVWLDRIVTE